MNKISMYRKVLGYMGGDKKQPIYQHMKGALVTNAVISCSQCRTMISGHNGPRQDAWCIKCTDEKIVTDAEEKVEARKKAAAEKVAAKKKADAEAAAKKKAEAEAEAENWSRLK